MGVFLGYFLNIRSARHSPRPAVFLSPQAYGQSSTKEASAEEREPKRLPRNYLRRNGGNVILNVLISFHSRDAFFTPSRLLGRPGFRSFCAARLAVHYLAVYSVSLREFSYKMSQNNNVK